MTKNGCGQPAGFPLHGHLPLFHGFEQRTLGLRCGTVDLIGQHDVGKNRAGMKLEATAVAIVDGNAKDVGRQEVTGKLNTLIVQTECRGERMRQGGLTHTGQILDQQVPASQQAGQRQAQLVLFPQDDGGNPGDDFIDVRIHATILW